MKEVSVEEVPSVEHVEEVAQPAATEVVEEADDVTEVSGPVQSFSYCPFYDF